MTILIKSGTTIKSQTLVNFPPTPALNLNFTQGYANGLNPLPSTVTFTRADASAIATQTGPDGLLRRAAHNLALRSQDLSVSPWQGATRSIDTTVPAPDGTLTATKIVYGGANQDAYQAITASAGTVRSVWLKGTAGETISFDDGAGLITTPNVITLTGVWQRVYFYLSAANAYVSIGTYNGVTARTVWVWGAQVEYNLTPSYYVPTTSAAVYANTPRFDYDPVTLLPKGLLIEEARTNALTKSQEMDDSAWRKSQTSVTANQTTAPDGTLTADLLSSDTSNNSHYFDRNAAVYSVSITSGTSYTYSIYMKKGSGATAPNIIQVALSGGAFPTGYANFNIGTGTLGTVSNVTATITSVGSGWYRCTVSNTANATNSSTGVAFVAFTNNDDSLGRLPSYADATTSNVFLWGGQFETGAFPTSYIPTTSASVTRAKEELTAGSAALPVFQGSVWTAVAEGTVSVSGVNAVEFLATSPVAAGNFVSMGYDASGLGGGGGPYLGWYASEIKPTIAANTNDTTIWRIAAGVSTSGTVSASANGSTTATSASSDYTGSITGVYFGSRPSANYINGHLRKVQAWTTRFTDAQLKIASKV